MVVQYDRSNWDGVVDFLKGTPTPVVRCQSAGSDCRLLRYADGSLGISKGSRSLGVWEPSEAFDCLGLFARISDVGSTLPLPLKFIRDLIQSSNSHRASTALDATRQLRALTDPSEIQIDYRNYWMHLYRRDIEQARRIVKDACRLWRPDQIYAHLFEPALQLSGSLWASGSIQYPDEHFITWQTRQFMRHIRRRFVPSETFGPLALATTVGGEQHLIGLQIACDFLPRANWRIHWPTSDDRATLMNCIQRLRPSALLLSIGTEERIPAARRFIRFLRRRAVPLLIVVGGHAINADPSLVRKLEADLTAPSGPDLARALA